MGSIPENRKKHQHLHQAKVEWTPNKTPSKSGTPIAKRFKKQSPSKQKLHSRPTRTTWLAAFAKKHYQQGFNLLWREGNASVNAAFLRFISRTVCQEMKKILLKRNNSILRTDTSPNSLHELTFQKLQEEDSERLRNVTKATP